MVLSCSVLLLIYVYCLERLADTEMEEICNLYQRRH